jgi:antitoxin component YwqK of YwqJK toxin-antitoxin module
MSNTRVKREYYPSGQLRLETNHNDGVRQGLHRVWHEDGPVEWKENYRNGKLHGVSQRYYPNGVLRMEVNYKNGVPHGPQRHWERDGQLLAEYKYDNGKLVNN